MNRFAIVHDGSEQGWQTAYLAFHIAAQLGAPLLVLQVDPTPDPLLLSQRAAQVGVSARAAGVSIRTILVAEFSVGVLVEAINEINGAFIPGRLLPDGSTAAKYQDALGCPLWIVSIKTEIHDIAVLVDGPAENKRLIEYATILSRRINQNLTLLVQEGGQPIIASAGDPVKSITIPDFSAGAVASAFQGLNAGLLFIPRSRISLIEDLPFNCIVFPDYPDNE